MYKPYISVIQPKKIFLKVWRRNWLYPSSWKTLCWSSIWHLPEGFSRIIWLNMACVICWLENCLQEMLTPLYMLLKAWSHTSSGLQASFQKPLCSAIGYLAGWEVWAGDRDRGVIMVAVVDIQWWLSVWGSQKVQGEKESPEGRALRLWHWKGKWKRGPLTGAWEAIEN